ncbi:MAG: H-type lectin domain-containing protein [Verrucomicrobiota bacterium]
MSDSYLPLKVISSTLCLGSETEGWTLDDKALDEDPERVFSFDVYFETPFSTPPVVHLGMTGFDIDQCSSSRLKATTTQVTENGFQVRLKTWRASRVYSVDLSWIAIGS